MEESDYKRPQVQVDLKLSNNTDIFTELQPDNTDFFHKR